MELSDQNLVERTQAELPYATASYELLAKRYYPAIRQIARSVVGNADDADTVAQEALLRVFHHLPKLREPVTFEAWLRRVVINLGRSFIAGEIREREKAARLMAEPVVEHEEPMPERNAGDLFNRLLAQLSVDERTIMTFRFVNELGFAEISQRTGLKLSATKMRYYRALEKLQQSMQADTEMFDGVGADHADAQGWVTA